MVIEQCPGKHNLSELYVMKRQLTDCTPQDNTNPLLRWRQVILGIPKSKTRPERTNLCRIAVSSRLVALSREEAD